MLSDMTADSVLDPWEIEKEKAVIVNEIGSVDDSPEEKGHEQYLRRLWGEHPLSRKITGEADEVRAIDRDALAAFYAERFGPDKLVVAVAGNFDLAEVRDLAAAALAGRGGGAARPARTRKTAPARGRPDRRPDASFVADRFTQVQLYAGTSYPLDRELAHYYTSLVFSTAFGESMSSRLFQRLREEQALCYTVYSFRTFYSDVGQWTVYANATPAQTGKLLAALDAELARLRREPLGALEIDDARSHLVGSMIISREDMESRMKRLARQHAMIERVLEFDESVAMIRAVGPVDGGALRRRARQVRRLQPPRLRQPRRGAPRRLPLHLLAPWPMPDGSLRGTRGGAAVVPERRSCRARTSVRTSPRTWSSLPAPAPWCPRASGWKSPRDTKDRSGPGRDSR